MAKTRLQGETSTESSIKSNGRMAAVVNNGPGLVQIKRAEICN